MVVVVVVLVVVKVLVVVLDEMMMVMFLRMTMTLRTPSIPDMSEEVGIFLNLEKSFLTMWSCNQVCQETGNPGMRESGNRNWFGEISGMQSAPVTG